jgi:rhodanese-related sulfurtransferase
MDLQISAEQLREWLRKRSVLLVDVRSKAEFQSHHLPGSIHLPVDSIGPDTLKGIPGAETVLVTICAHGFRSQKAAERIRQCGFSDAYSLKGGLEAWEQSSKTSKSCSTGSAGFDRPRSVIYGAIHCVGALLALFVDP